jgi:hypothetical protein
MKHLLLWFLNRTLLRFNGRVVTLRFKSGAVMRFRCDNYSFKHTPDELRSYEFDNTRSMLGTPMNVWFVISDVESLTVRTWRLF